MSAVEVSKSLLGHDDTLPIQRWNEDIAASNFNRRRRICAITLLLILLTIVFVSGIELYAKFDAPGLKLSEHPNPAQELRHERDLKWLLHPEDHVSREPGIRHFSWNITKAEVAPNGVKKDVFLINGTTNVHPAL